MILARVLVTLTLDGIVAGIARLYNGKSYLSLIGPERVQGDPHSRYNPFMDGGTPAPEDESSFALLYRKMQTIGPKIGLEGPYGEDDHPLLYNRFSYTHWHSPKELLEFLQKEGIQIRVIQVVHGGDDAEVVQARIDFAKWIDEDTVFDPHPSTVARLETPAPEEVLALSPKFSQYVLYPLFVVATLVAFSIHPALGVGVVALILVRFLVLRN